MANNRFFVLVFILLTTSFLLFLAKEKIEKKLLTFFRPLKKEDLISQKKVQEILSSDGNFQQEEAEAVWFNKKITALSSPLAEKDLRETQVLGEETEEKWVEVDLSKQTLYAHQGDKVVYQFPISSGLPWTPTVAGEFRVWIKLKYHTMTGGLKEKGTYYYLPNVPYVMYFYKGYGLHGTYWHNDFGKPKSHGCINLSIADAEKLFFWIHPRLPEEKSVVLSTNDNPGTRIFIYGKTPGT